MFNTGRRTMEDVLLEHIGHDIELYEFTEDGRDGIELWCNTCNDYIIKHFLTNPRPAVPAWDVDEEFIPSREQNPPIYRAATGGFSARVWDVDEEDTWET